MKLLEKIDLLTKNNISDTDLSRVIELAMFAEDELLVEALGIDKLKNVDFTKKIKLALKKIGLHAEAGDGLLQIAAKSSVVLSKFLWYAIKASGGDEKSKGKLQELVDTNQVTKEQLLDFLLKLDTLTLHFITGPIHMIDALTGWHVGANIHNSVKTIETKAHDVINSLSDLTKEATGNLKITLKGYTSRLKALLDIDSSALEKKILKRSDKG